MSAYVSDSYALILCIISSYYSYKYIYIYIYSTYTYTCFDVCIYIYTCVRIFLFTRILISVRISEWSFLLARSLTRAVCIRSTDHRTHQSTWRSDTRVCRLPHTCCALASAHRCSIYHSKRDLYLVKCGSVHTPREEKHIFCTEQLPSTTKQNSF